MSLDDSDSEIQQWLQMERDVVHISLRATPKTQKLFALPTRVANADIIGFYRRVSEKPMTEAEALLLANRDLGEMMVALRPKLGPLVPIIGEVRSAAVLQVGLVLNGGTGQKLIELTDLWPTLRAQDYEAAYDIVMVTGWQTFFGINEETRRRALAIGRMLRTGVEPV